MAYDPANPYANKQGTNSPFDYLRNKATADAGNQESQGLDALTRRYAAMGNLNSGSYTKAIQANSTATQERNQDAQGKIDVAENAQALPYAQLAAQKEQFGQQLGFEGKKLDQAASQFGQQQAQQESQFGRELPMKSRQLDLEASQQAMDQRANDINADMGKYQMQHSGGLFGGGGFIGSGLGFSDGGLSQAGIGGGK